MQTLLRNIQLNFVTDAIKLTVGNLSLKTNYIKLKDEERFKERGCLFEKEHSSLQTQFDLTGFDDCQLLCFDEALQFEEIRYYRNYQGAPFSFLISEPYVLLLPTSAKYPIHVFRSIEFLDYPSIPGVYHVFGTDAEKVDILATNPHRFYISEYGVWILPDRNRIDILNVIYEKALNANNELLCKRIEKVKAQLLCLPDYKKE